jgi:hypothetical protein
MKLPIKTQRVTVLQSGKAKSRQAQCPRCKSVRLQRGYKDGFFLFRLVRRYELLCNNCGLEFKSLDLWDDLTRKPSTKKESRLNVRRATRYQAHLPVTICLAEREPFGDKLVFSKPSRGHCKVISKAGLALSFVGSRFGERAFNRAGRLLLVNIMLPNAPVDVLITTVTHTRVESAEGTPTWFISATITQMSERDTARLATYLGERAKREPVFLQE